MGKGRLQSRAKQGRHPQAVSDNPFESREITRKKHNVFNRKVKGEKRNVAKTRIRATQNRKNTLLLDFESSRKANDFRDRRFGEDDANLQLEEKMWARIQRERRKRSRSSQVFNLGDDSGASDLITHKGQALEDVDLSEDGDRASDEELGAEVVDQLHFGGGAGGASQAHEGQRNRHEILNDIIARSKERKMEKAREKEEQESERERLDKGLDDVLSVLLPGPPEANMKQKSEADDYDRMMRELVYEVRAQATDRVQTPEETAKMEKAKLEALERARLERMSNQVIDHEISAHQDEGSRKRKKILNDDELSDSYDTNETLDEDTPLAKQVIDDTDSAVSDTDSEMCAELEASEGVNLDEVAEDRVRTNGPDPQDKDACWTERDSIINLERQSEGIRQHLEMKEIPYVLDCPSSYEEFLSLLAKYARNADDVNIITDRIYKNHRVKLDKRNKAKMHNFYDMLLKRFRRLGSNIEKLSPLDRQDRASQLHYLSGLIFDMSAEMPDVASSVWHRVVGELHRQMVKATADFSVNASTSGCWPGVGSLLRLKLLVQIFPCTDFRHSVVTPAMLYLSQCISSCSVRSAGELGEGVLCSGLLLHCSLGANRLAPEALTFLCSALEHFGATVSTVRSAVTYQTLVSPALRKAPLGWLREATARYKEDELPHFVLGMSEESASRETLATALMAAIYRLLRRAVEQLRGNIAFAEMFYPLMNALTKVNPQGTPELPAKLQALHFDLRLTAVGISEALSATRGPLQWRDTDPPKLGVFAPKFHDNYNMKKGIHEDPEQSKIKQLQRQIKREHKGAMRELKRDSVFLERAKADIAAEKEAERKRRLRDNLTWLEEQQATINQQVKLGGKLVAGGGSSVTKGARVGRGH